MKNLTEIGITNIVNQFPTHSRRAHRCRGTAYGMMYGMRKTTVYLPHDIKQALTQTAEARGVSEAELIREAIRNLTAVTTPPRPRLPLFKSGKPSLAERVDAALRGFGER
jgi:hypothetical protein